MPLFRAKLYPPAFLDLFIWAYERSIQEYRVIRQQLADLRALIVDELRRLHEGVLARYGLRP